MTDQELAATVHSLGFDPRLGPLATPAPKYPEALVERMVDLIHSATMVPGPIGDEARAIVAELPAEVDADEALASRIVDDAGNGLISREQRIAKVVEHLRGRALADADAGRGA